VDLTVRVSGDASDDDLGRLRGWLLDEPLLRGRVRLQQATVAAGAMSGGVVDGLLVFAAGGGAVATAARVRTAGSVLITWLKGRRGDVQATVTSAHGETVSLSVTNVHGLTSAEVSAWLDNMVEKLGGAAVAEPAQTGAGDDERCGPPADPEGSSQAAG
jgi:hypothetical protein